MSQHFKIIDLFKSVVKTALAITVSAITEFLGLLNTIFLYDLTDFNNIGQLLFKSSSPSIESIQMFFGNNKILLIYFLNIVCLIFTNLLFQV